MQFLDLRATNHYAEPISHDASAVVFSNATLSWDVTADAAVILHDVNLKIPRGKLTIVVGEVGAGKTALVSALLNEMHVQSVSSRT